MRGGASESWVAAARAFALPVVLVLVASTQIVLAHTADLTPWKGGGFGMFASMDQLQTRVARIELIDAEDRVLSVALDRYAQTVPIIDVLERARAMPDERTLERIATTTRAIDWAESEEVAVPATDDEAGDLIDVRQIRVSVWVYTFEREDRTLVPRLLAELTVPNP